VRYSAERMVHHMAEQKITLNGVLLVEYVDYSLELGREILLGFRQSDAFGPVISFSKGGTDAEHFARYFSAPNLILAPINRQWAQALLASTHIQEKYRQTGLSGFIPTIVDACMKLSELATTFSNFFAHPHPWVITEFEVNPFVFVGQNRFVALDGFARFARRARVMPGPQNKAPKKHATIFQTQWYCRGGCQRE
jgi:hypothetical protein